MLSVDRRPAGVAIGLIVLVLAGCGGTGAAPSDTSTADAEPSSSAALVTDPSAGDGARYVCLPDHPSFTIEDLLTAPPADDVDDPARAVLEDVLAAGWLPMDAWRRVVVTVDEVVLVAEWPGGEAPYAVVNVVPGGGATQLHEGWGADSYGACTPRPVAPAGTSVANWYLDPSAAPPVPDADTIAVLVHEQACASGQSAEGRILAPMVEYGEDDVTITILVRTDPGECPGNPATPFVIRLAEPIGDRVLLDGGRHPAGDPREIPEGEFSLPR